MGRTAKIVGLVAVAIVATTISLEALLQLASFFAPDRSSAWRPNSSQRILCIGDSHTWGSGAPKGESYPAHLQKLLDEQSPGTYSVLNLGLPGMNTSQVRSRLSVLLGRYNPDYIVVWVGVNNNWNNADRDPGETNSSLEALAVYSRLYRLIRVWLHDRELRRYDVENSADLVYSIEKAPGTVGEIWGMREHPWVVRHDGVVETITHVKSHEKSKFTTLVEWASSDYRAILKLAQSMGAATVFITYPRVLNPLFQPFNQALKMVDAEADVNLVESETSLSRVSPDALRFDSQIHPNGPAYKEIARDVMELIVGLSRVPDERR